LSRHERYCYCRDAAVIAAALLMLSPPPHTACRAARRYHVATMLMPRCRYAATPL